MDVIYGVNPVLELLRAHPERIERIYLADGAKVHDQEQLYLLARGAGVRVERVPRERIARLAGGKAHQGVLAEVSDAQYAELDELIAFAREGEREPLVVALDQIQDPMHLGTAIRCTDALGGHGVVIPQDRAAGLGPAAIKASAGASAHLRVVRTVNLARALDDLKEAGLWVYGADMEGDPADRLDLTGPACLVIGSEGKGLRPIIRARCDRIVSIPMIAGGVGSLSASAAAAILLYEITRQRRATKPSVR